MKKNTIGFILIILLGLLGIVGWKYLKPVLFEKKQLLTSDAKKIAQTIRLAGDNYLGYWFITSAEMRKLSARKGFQIDFTNDGGAYAQRLENFNNGATDCIVLPVNSYLLHGAKYKFPGVIVASLSESKGADGLVGLAERFNTGKINDLNDPSLKIVYTADSPSSFLLDLTIADFDLDKLQSSMDWQVQVESSEAVLKLAQKGRGDAFVLWEPDLSKALALPGMKYLWGSDRFSGYIIDVIVFRRDYLEKHEEFVRDFLRTYFQVLAIYANNREMMITEMSRSTELKKETIETQLAKIDWFDLAENCERQFGISTRSGQVVQEGLINTIIACTNVMIRTKGLEKDPLQGNPYKIINSSILQQIAQNQTTGLGGNTNKTTASFSELSENQWNQLPEIGTFRLEPITFQSWNNLLTGEGKEIVDKIAVLLINHYPEYRIVIRGHTGAGGEEQENRKLSLARANAVSQYLQAVYDMDVRRIKTEGHGSGIPLKRRADESERAYQYRLSRVEFIAVEGGRL